MAADNMLQMSWRSTPLDAVKVTNALRARIAIEAQTYAQNVLDSAQQNVRVATGETRDSGQIVQVDEVTYKVVFGGAAIWLEFGTATRPAYPFLAPSAYSQLPAYLARLAMTTQGRVASSQVTVGE